MSTSDELRCDTIGLKRFKAELDGYGDVVPEKVGELEQQRLEIIPRALAEREIAYLTKAEIQTLVDWKLSHGTFRPSLQKLVASNAEETVEESTKAAFAYYGANNTRWDDAVAMLAKDLRGVGPATATLLLSVFDSVNIPFFSDELFRWTTFEEGKGRGWDRKIKYSIGEYKQMYPLVQAVRDRLQAEGQTVTALEVEKVAYVIGKRSGTAAVAADSKSTKATKKRKLEEPDSAGQEDQEVEAPPSKETRRTSKWKQFPPPA
ncbi:hypothetical protein AAFC00_003001 [Neodothiora populina]|uniref:HhH-GPD domain-containing protein n=1 Tax=Neodothiora populina TaxID=2781224 RepID=A0ABR3P973_9PEZI